MNNKNQRVKFDESIKDILLQIMYYGLIVMTLLSDYEALNLFRKVTIVIGILWFLLNGSIPVIAIGFWILLNFLILILKILKK